MSLRTAVAPAIAAALLLAGCEMPRAPDAATVAEADDTERAIDELERMALRYGTRDSAVVRDAYAGSGMIAGRRVTCGRTEAPENSTYGGSFPRVILIDRTDVIDGTLGQKPAVFEELWRRAGC